MGHFQNTALLGRNCESIIDCRLAKHYTCAVYRPWLNSGVDKRANFPSAVYFKARCTGLSLLHKNQ